MLLDSCEIQGIFWNLTGEFATQTCFQGVPKSDQFGGQILIHHPEMDTGNTKILVRFIHISHQQLISVAKQL